MQRQRAPERKSQPPKEGEVGDRERCKSPTQPTQRFKFKQTSWCVSLPNLVETFYKFTLKCMIFLQNFNMHKITKFAWTWISVLWTWKPVNRSDYVQITFNYVQITFDYVQVAQKLRKYYVKKTAPKWSSGNALIFFQKSSFSHETCS